MRQILLFTLMLIAFQGFSQTTLPIDFDGAEVVRTDFDGGVTSIIDNPQSMGINTSAKVVQMVKNADKTWGGTKIELTGKIDFSTNQVFSMKVFSPRAGVPVLFKVEGTDYTTSTGVTTSTTVANQWETLSFDFTGSNSDTYWNLVIIFQDGTMGDGTADWTFLLDDIEFSPSPIPPLTLPIDFEAGPYNFMDFDGGAATVIDNPQSSGINTSAKVAQLVRNGGATWAGSKLILDSKIDFSSKTAFSMKVFSTRADVPVLLKLEGDAATQYSVNTTVAGEWETLTWDFTGAASDTYNTLAFMFDFDAMGDGTANSTFLFDDIEQIDNTGGLSQIDLPVNFEGSTINYSVDDFGGNATVLGAGPTDANNMVAVTTKTTGSETWAGTTIGTALGFANAVPFTETQKTIKVKVYSPASGVTVRLKAEDHSNNTLTAETEATTTVANAWETLSFDFSEVAAGTNPFNLATNFDKVSIFFNFGVSGTGEVYYWDDVEFVSTIMAVSLNNFDNINIFATNGVLNITGANDFIKGKVEVFSLTGQKIISQTISNTTEQLSINNGLYIVRISDTNNTQVFSKKVLVK